MDEEEALSWVRFLRARLTKFGPMTWRKARGKPIWWVNQMVRQEESKATGLEGGVGWLVSFEKLSDFCECSAVEGMTCLKMLGATNTSQSIACKEWKHKGKMPRGFRIDLEGAADELEQYIAKLTQYPRNQRLEDRSVSLKTSRKAVCQCKRWS